MIILDMILAGSDAIVDFFACHSFYVAAAILILWKINKLGIIPLLLIAVNLLFAGELFFDISLVVLGFTTVLVYLLVEDMNRSFHKEA